MAEKTHQVFGTPCTNQVWASTLAETTIHFSKHIRFNAYGDSDGLFQATEGGYFMWYRIECDFERKWTIRGGTHILVVSIFQEKMPTFSSLKVAEASGAVIAATTVFAAMNFVDLLWWTSSGGQSSFSKGLVYLYSVFRFVKGRQGDWWRWICQGYYRLRGQGSLIIHHCWSQGPFWLSVGPR